MADSDKGKLAILALLLVGGAVALKGKSAQAATPPSGPAAPPFKIPPPGVTDPATGFNVSPLGTLTLPTATGELPPVDYAAALKAGSASLQQQTDFVLRYETDPAALENWANGGPDTGMGGGALASIDPSGHAACVAKIAAVLSAITRGTPSVPNQSLSQESAYAQYSPNGYWPSYAYGLPLYIANAADALPRPDAAIGPGDLTNWSFLMADTCDLATLQRDLNDYDARGLPACANAIATKLRALCNVRAKYGFSLGGVLINIPAKYGGNPAGAQDVGGGAPPQAVRANVQRIVATKGRRF